MTLAFVEDRCKEGLNAAEAGGLDHFFRFTPRPASLRLAILLSFAKKQLFLRPISSSTSSSDSAAQPKFQCSFSRNSIPAI